MGVLWWWKFWFLISGIRRIIHCSKILRTIIQSSAFLWEPFCHSTHIKYIWWQPWPHVSLGTIHSWIASKATHKSFIVLVIVSTNISLTASNVVFVCFLLHLLLLQTISCHSISQPLYAVGSWNVHGLEIQCVFPLQIVPFRGCRWSYNLHDRFWDKKLCF